ncbi:hypothetical protein ACGYLO_11945 [Sulfitobacter sp. 1A13353]|uniref:hypothetical protein n=1 Tax=Sulfitobacter sp. 1A13353 TaxID=3368568 RepID=UPI003746CF19
MTEKPATRIVLKQIDDGYFMRKEADFPARDGSLAFDLRKKEDSWTVNQTVAVDCGISSIMQFSVDGIERPASIARDRVLSFISPFMADIEDTDPEVAFKKMLEAAAGHPLIRGLHIEVDGKVETLCEAFSDSEIEDKASEILDIRDEQRLLKGLEILGYNNDKQTCFLIVETAADKAEFVRRYQLSLKEEMDLIVEAQVDRATDFSQIKFLDPVGVFQLSKNPRFDYDTRTLTGVTEYHGLEGGFRNHDDIWTSKAIMRRLPDEDITQEDVRFSIGCALDKLCDETPEPS